MMMMMMSAECYPLCYDSEIRTALERRGVSPAEDADMVDSVKKAVRRLCARDVVCARIIENEAKELTSIECGHLLHRLTNGKVLHAFYCCCCRVCAIGNNFPSYRGHPLRKP